MGDFGDSIKDIFSTLVTDTSKFASTVTLEQREPENGAYGGYEEGTDGVWDSSDILATILPDTNATRTALNVSGDLKIGDMILFTSGTQSICDKDRIIHSGTKYHVRDITTFHTNDVDIVKQVSLSRVLDDG